MGKIPLTAYAFSHTTDIDPNWKIDSLEWDRIAQACVSRATDALERPTGTYTEVHRYHMQNIFHSMVGTQRTLRILLEKSETAPDAVDVLALSRLQLEALYTICLLLEGSDYVATYLRDHWRKIYVKFLLQREECKALPRFQEYIERAPAPMIYLRNYLDVSDRQQRTVDYEELGIPLPAGEKLEPIPRFPSPGKVIDKVQTGSKRKMLQRLYPEYERLSTFVHGLAEAGLVKQMFDKRSPHYNMFSTAHKEETFRKIVVSDAMTMSFLCLLQCTAELITLYPNDIELNEVAIRGWNSLSEASLLGRTVWAIRTKGLLGIVG